MATSSDVRCSMQLAWSRRRRERPGPKHTPAARPLNRPELGNCSCSHRACCSTSIHLPREPGTVGREALLQRSRDLLAGRWDTLLSASRAAAAASPRAGSAADVTDADHNEAFREQRRAFACANVRRGEVSRARATLTSAASAPGTDETIAALMPYPERRPPVPLHEVPTALLNF